MKRPVVSASTQSDGSDSGSASAGDRAAGACSKAMTQAVTVTDPATAAKISRAAKCPVHAASTSDLVVTTLGQDKPPQ